MNDITKRFEAIIDSYTCVSYKERVSPMEFYVGNIPKAAKACALIHKEEAIRLLQFIFDEGILFHGNKLQEMEPDELYDLFTSQNKEE